MSQAGTSSNGYRWLRDGLVPGQNALLETLWVFAWANLILASNAGTASHRFPLPFLLALIAVPALAGRWLESRVRLPLLVRRVLLVALCVGLFLAFVKTQTLAGEPLLGWRLLRDAFLPWTSGEAASRLGLVAFGWLVACVLLVRGCWLALGRVRPESADRWFLGGLVAFVVLLLLIAGPGMTPASFRQDRAWLGPLLGAYFLLGLGWVGLVRQQHLEERAFRRRSDRLSLSWLVVFSAISGAMLAAGASVAALNGILGGVEALAIAAGEATWRALAAAWAWLTGLVQSLLGALPSSRPPRGGRPVAPATPPPAPLHLPAWHFPALPPFDVPVGFVLLLLLVALGGWVLLRYRRWDAGQAEDEERTSVWSWRLLWDGLRRLPGQVVAGLRRRRGARRQASRSAAALPGQPAPTSLRSLYRAVLRWSADRGQGRAPNQTPHEFEPDLASVISAELAGDLTSGYVRARYGGTEPPDVEVERLRERWEEARDRQA
ncbi:MAG TPA: DUF4129 domain-containing protein [Terriglobales bacterium]|nr:DUF4129 domain-containing protein [Terriglobales bacterium]